MDRGRKKLCFLDDNFLACAEWERLLDEVLETGKSFQFRQGLDLRIMRKRQMEKLFSGKTDGDILFAKNVMEFAQSYQQQDSSSMNSAIKGIVAGLIMAGISSVLAFLGIS